MADELLYEHFEGLVGSVFTPCEPDFASVSFTLDQAERLRADLTMPGIRPPFSLIFLSAEERVLPQRLYRLAHDTLGEIDIALVPVGREARGVLYQAVFN